MAERSPSSMVIPMECIPGREAVEAFAPYSSIIFPDEHQVYESSFFNRYDVKTSGDCKNETLIRLLREVDVVKKVVASQGDTGDVERILAAAYVQTILLKDIDGAMAGMIRRGVSILEATYVLDDFINIRDQQKHSELSKSIADDVRLYYALQNGGELPMQAPIEEMILDYSEPFEELETDIKAHMLAMERLKFEWMTASVAVNAVREDISLNDSVMRKGFGLE